MKRLTLFSLFLLLIASWGFSQADLQPAAIVNLTKSEPITVRQLRTEVERMERSTGRRLTNDERREVLDAMINEKLAIQAADRDKITVSENDVNTRINQLKGQMGMVLGRPPSDAEFATAVKNETGLELPAFREQLKRQLIVQKYLMTKKESNFNAIKAPTEEEIRSRYELTKTQYIIPETVVFSLIEVPYGPDSASRTRAKELADRLAREIGSNPNQFEVVAARAQMPNSGYQTMSRITMPRNLEAQSQVGESFMNTAFTLNLNDVSRVIEGQGSYQIIKITSKTVMMHLGLNDIVPGITMADGKTPVSVRDGIGTTILQERHMETLAKATEELITELRAGGRTFTVYERNLTW